jgi:RNA polymerase sigma-70 factor (ECF subfamily)
MDSTTVAQCVRDAQRGDPLAREALAGHWAPLALAWCARMGGPRVDAEDAAHDALIVALQRVGTLHSAEKADAWLYGIVRRTLAWHRRKAWLGRWLPWGDGDSPDPGADPFGSVQRDAAAVRVRDLLERLPDAQREVLVLCVVEERTVAEVALLIGVPEGTVKSRLRLARERCRALSHADDLADAIPEVMSW